jgi:hypothetical protein
VPPQRARVRVRTTVSHACSCLPWQLQAENKCDCDCQITEKNSTGSPRDVGFDQDFSFDSYQSVTTEERCPPEDEVVAFCQGPCDNYCTTNAYIHEDGRWHLGEWHLGEKMYATSSVVRSCETEANRCHEAVEAAAAGAAAFFAGAKDALSEKVSEDVSVLGMLTQGARGATRPPWSHDWIGFLPTSR